MRRRAWDALIWLLSRPAARRYAPLVESPEQRTRREAAEHTNTLARLRRALGKES